VRAQNGDEAQERLRSNFVRYFADPFDPERVRPLVGDLSQPNLGLTADTYETLAKETDIIVHNGAHLHHTAPYAHLKGSNVDSTVAMLRLATTTKPKWVNYVSTLVAAVDRDSEGYLLEGLPQSDPAELAGGYAQSKWVSEKLLDQAVQRGIGVSIFRPGFISGRIDNGAWPLENDHLLRIIKGCVQMRCASESNLTINMAPVDFVSAAIVRIALSPHAAGQVFNLSNPHLVAWEALLGWLQGFGYRFRVVSNEVWRDQHLQYLDSENALFPVLPLYLGGEITDRHEALLSKLAKVRNDRTEQMLTRLRVSFPVIDQALWRRYVRYFQESGFLPVPD
jgi:thioester reductase-like protein